MLPKEAIDDHFHNREFDNVVLALRCNADRVEVAVGSVEASGSLDLVAISLLALLWLCSRTSE